MQAKADKYLHLAMNRLLERPSCPLSMGSVSSWSDVDSQGSFARMGDVCPFRLGSCRVGIVCLGADLQLTDFVSQEICAPEELELDSFSLEY